MPGGPGERVFARASIWFFRSVDRTGGSEFAVIIVTRSMLNPEHVKTIRTVNNRFKSACGPTQTQNAVSQITMTMMLTLTPRTRALRLY